MALDNNRTNVMQQTEGRIAALEKELSLGRQKAASGRAAVEADIKAGERILGKEFEEGSLGRLETDRTTDVKDIIERRRSQLGGLSSEEAQALREKSTQEIDRGTQTALRSQRGRSASLGIRGGSAGASEGRIEGAGIKAKADVERDLLIRNIDERRANLGAFEESVVGAEQRGESREIFNIEQSASEKLGRISAGLGFAQLGVAERSSERGVQAAQASAPSGGKK